MLDISFDDEADNSLRGRCYGNDVAQVIRNAGAFNDGLRAAGILSCGKHFPGYSRAPLDAHHELPEIDRTRAELDAHELAVFRHFADEVDSMMIGHGFYPALDQRHAVFAVAARDHRICCAANMGFRGLVMTDDLDMGAILNHYGLEETIRLAITAGNDLAMICHRIEVVEARAAISSMCPPRRRTARWRMSRSSRQRSPPDPWGEAEFRRRDAEVWDLRVDVLGAEPPPNAARTTASARRWRCTKMPCASSLARAFTLLVIECRPIRVGVIDRYEINRTRPASSELPPASSRCQPTESVLCR